MREVRYFKSEVRKAEGNFIEGYGALYNVRSLDMGFIETIMPGAFDKADISDVRMLWNHNGDMVMARSKNGTLSVNADERGLFYRGDVALTSYGHDALISVERGDVDQSSFAFDLDFQKDDEWDFDDDGRMHRKIHRIRSVADVSPTAFPAYPQTKIDKRALAEIQEILQKPKRDIDRIDAMIKVHQILSKH